MQRFEENKLVMFEAVEAVLSKNQAAVETLPALAEAKEEFAALITQITDTEKKFGTVTVGKVAARDAVENDLIEALLALKGALASLARKSKNAELSHLVKLTKSDLQRLGDTELDNKAATVLELVQANKTALAAYNVDDTEITEFTAALQAFKTARTTKQTSFTGKSGARVSLSELFDAADEVLKIDLDNLMLRMKKGHPDFVNEYQAARVTKDLGGRHKDDEDETPSPPDEPTPPAQ